MKNSDEIAKILVTLFAITIILLLCSCGARKTKKSVVKDSSTTEINSQLENKIEKSTETFKKVDDETNEIEITPIDTAKVLIINGKVYKNAKVKISNRKIKTDIVAKETFSDKSASKTKAISTAKKQTRVKNTERKSNPFAPLFWILFPAAIYTIWRYKYKLVGL